MARFLITALYDYEDFPGGSQKLAYEQARYLVAQGHDVWYLAQDPTSERPPYQQRDGLHILLYPSPKLRLFDPRRRTIHQQEAQKLIRQYMPNPPDVVHGHILLTYAGILEMFPSACYVYSIHSPVKLELQAGGRGQSVMQQLKLTIASHMTHGIEKRVLSQSMLVTAFSEYTKKTITTLHGTSLGDKVQVVAGWVDINQFSIAQDRPALKQSLGVVDDVPFFFTLRRLEPRNGVDILLHALKIVHDAGYDFQMVIGGGGSQKERLIALRDTLGLTDKVRFLGRVSDADLPRWYSACDVFLLPTHTLECFGIITLEALASGRAVIATPVGAIPEILNGIEPRWLAKSNHPQDFADCIMAYLRGNLPDHAPTILRDFVQTQYDKNLQLAQLERLILT